MNAAKFIAWRVFFKYVKFAKFQIQIHDKMYLKYISKYKYNKSI